MRAMSHLTRSSRTCRRLAIAAVLGLVWLCSQPKASSACDLSWWCEQAGGCAWAQRSIPIWALTEWNGTGTDMRLQSVPGGFSASDWENMIQQAAVIYREESGADIELYFGGHTSDHHGDGSITVRGDPVTCDSKIAWGEVDTTENPLYLGDIQEGFIQFRHQSQNSSGACVPISWTASSQTSRDIVATLVHELGHTLGRGHPSRCDQDVASYMESSAPGWSRYFSRYDKRILREMYGRADAIGKRRRLTASPNTWGSPVAWPMIAPEDQRIIARPKSLPTLSSNLQLAWSTYAENRASVKWTPLTNTWGNYQSSSSSYSEALSSPAVVSSGPTPSSVEWTRIYFLYEPQEYDGAATQKKICYVQTTNGITFQGRQCPEDKNGNPFTTRADGISATYDVHTNTFLVAYLSCDETGCSNVNVIVQPGISSGLAHSRVTSTSFSSTATPSIACSPGSASNRCVIAYKPGGTFPKLQWQEGSPMLDSSDSTRYWISTGDFQATQSRLDAAPSVVWSVLDDAYFVSLFVAAGPDSELRVRRKAAGANNWTNPGIVASDVERGISPGTLSVPVYATGVDSIDVYYLEYQ